MDDSVSIFDEESDFSSGVSTTSISLLMRAQLRDDVAWSRLVRLYAPLVYHWCKQGGVRNDDLDDVVQEIFITVARKLPQFQGPGHSGSFRGWLHSISKNKAIDHFRAQRGLSSNEDQDQLDELAVMELTDELEAEEERLLLRQAISMIEKEFSETMWKAFWETYIVGRSAAEVAAELNVSRNVIYLAKSRVRNRLKDDFSDFLS